MSCKGEDDLRRGDKLCRWIPIPMSSEQVEKVIKIYDKANSGFDDSPPLIYASYLGLEYIVNSFIHCAIKTNKNLQTGETGEFQKFLWLRNKKHQTALDVAIENNHVEVAKILLANASLECLISERNYKGQLPVSLLSDPQHDWFIFTTLYAAKRKEVPDSPTSTLIPVDDYRQEGSLGYTDITMDPHSYPVSQDNDIYLSLDKLCWRQVELTPNKNTILHLVSECGDVKCVKDILKDYSFLLSHRNSEGETPAYVAAREGHLDILAIMISHFKKENIFIAPLLTRDTDKHTALHIAIENHHVGVVCWLIMEIPQLIHSINNFSEIPHYLAAERGFHCLLEQTLMYCNQKDFTRPDGKTTLHAAAISGSTDSIRAVVKYSKDLLYKVDKRGWTPLRYAIYFNNSSATAALLDADCSMGYQMLEKDDITTLPIYIAASQGHCETMKALISRCPGCLEITYGNGRNILHFAIENKKTEVIEFIFGHQLFTRLINKKDSDGNTPIHLFMESSLEMMEVIMDTRVKIHALNNEKRTPFDLASSDEKREKLLKGIATVRSRGNQTRVLFPILNDIPLIDEPWRQKLIAEKEEEKLEKEQKELKNETTQKIIEQLLTGVDNLVLVATLIATATFAAGFAVPGGFDGNEGSQQGMPILLKKTVFQFFMVTNIIAFSCSCSVLLGYIYMADFRASAFFNDEEQWVALYLKVLGRMRTMNLLTGIALWTMACAFVTGTYVLLAQSLGFKLFLFVMSVFIPFMTVFPSKAYQISLKSRPAESRSG